MWTATTISSCQYLSAITGEEFDTDTEKMNAIELCFRTVLSVDNPEWKRSKEDRITDKDLFRYWKRHLFPMHNTSAKAMDWYTLWGLPSTDLAILERESIIAEVWPQLTPTLLKMWEFSLHQSRFLEAVQLKLLALRPGMCCYDMGFDGPCVCFNYS